MTAVPARVAVAVALAVLAACGESGSSSDVASGPPETTVATAPPDGPSTTEAATGTTRNRPRVTLPAGGPSGPVDPPGTEAYRLLTAGGAGCRDLLTAIESQWTLDSPSGRNIEPRLFYLYRAAAKACLLRWADAKADFDRLQSLRPAPTYNTTCSGPEERYCERCHRLVLEWLTSQLEAYRRDPSYAPTIVRSTGPPPCPADTTTSTTRPATTITSPSRSTTTTQRR